MGLTARETGQEMGIDNEDGRQIALLAKVGLLCDIADAAERFMDNPPSVKAQMELVDLLSRWKRVK
jgi:hypothetical protein